MACHREAIPDGEDPTASGDGPAVAIIAALIAPQFNFCPHHRTILGELFGELGVAHRCGDVIFGGGQGQHLLDLADNPAKAAPLIPHRHHFHRESKR